MARLPSGALALTATLPDGTTDFTPWDPVTLNPLKRPFAAFSPSVPTPPPQHYFHVCPEERRRRAENEAWVARQLALYAAAPGPRFWDRDKQQRGLRLRGGGGGGDGYGVEEEVVVAAVVEVEKEESTLTTPSSSAAVAALLRLLLPTAATIRERAARAQFSMSRARYQFAAYRRREDVRRVVAALRLALLVGAVLLGLAVFWALLLARGGDGDGGNDNEFVSYVLVPNYQAWSLVPPVPVPVPPPTSSSSS
ncbi:hypothetical protein F5X96DRAFT_293190 [Biscogniauxia mediterranea]|nr:hypothetical protein F5X96DRAFT_293190 [Biscogniauxia mediterranea]